MPIALINRIDEASVDEIGQIAVAVIDRIGQLGREGREAVQTAIERERASSSDPTDLEEGMAQLEDIFS